MATPVSRRSRKSEITGIQVSADRVVPRRRRRRREMVGSIPVEMLMSALCHIPVLLVPVHTHLHHSTDREYRGVSTESTESTRSRETLSYSLSLQRRRAQACVIHACARMHTRECPHACSRSSCNRNARATHRNASPVLSSLPFGVACPL